MTRLEQIEFETKEKFIEAINKLLMNEDAYKTYTGKDNQPVRKKIISKGRLYFNNGFCFKVSVAQNFKTYCSIEYFGVDDRINLAKNNNK